MFIVFSQLLNHLYFSNSQLRKEALLLDYFSRMPDPDRGYALASLAGTLHMPLYRRARLKALLVERVDATLFALSYDYVGELAETLAHLWPAQPQDFSVQDLRLSDIVDIFQGKDIQDAEQFLCCCLDVMSYSERWAFLKFLGSSMRVGMSLRSCKRVLAQLGGKQIQDIERVWHGVAPPYQDLFSWLSGDLDTELLVQDVHFTPVMLAHPLESATIPNLEMSEWQVEWKFDGIRIQYVMDEQGFCRVYSRTGEDISNSFPDIPRLGSASVVIDAELLVGTPAKIADFNALQQRLGKLKPSAAIQRKYPVLLMAYDLLRYGDTWLLDYPLSTRRQALEQFCTEVDSQQLLMSEALYCRSTQDVMTLQVESLLYNRAPVEGLMLKRLDSLYQSGRPRGQWWKLKRDPHTIDAVLVYAQRGHGKRSSLYSDYTFAVWHDEELLPVGKAYSGFTDEELKELNQWVRKNTVGQFGPMRQLRPALVVEVAFDVVMVAPRRRAGVSLRFPRIHRIRWDKPAAEADHLSHLRGLLPGDLI